MESGNSPSQGAGQTRKGRAPVPPSPPPTEATSLERLFSMALALADKPYQLISPSHRQTASALANGTLVPLAACPAGQGRCAGRRSGETQSSAARGQSSTGRSHTGPQMDPPHGCPQPSSPTRRPRGPPPRSCVCPQGRAATCADSWKHPLPISGSTVTPISQRHTSNSSTPPSLPSALAGRSLKQPHTTHKLAGTHRTETIHQVSRTHKRKRTD